MTRKLALLAAIAAIAALAWQVLKPPHAARYFTTKPAEFDVELWNGVHGPFKGSAKVYHEGTRVVDGREYHKFATIFDSHLQIPPEVLYTRMDATGIFTRTTDNRLDSEEYPVLPFPIQTGRRWRHHLRGYWMDNLITQVVRFEKSGKAYHHCVQVHSHGRTEGKPRNVSMTTLYAPDLGMVNMTYSTFGRRIEMTRKGE